MHGMLFIPEILVLFDDETLCGKLGIDIETIRKQKSFILKLQQTIQISSASFAEPARTISTTKWGEVLECTPVDEIIWEMEDIDDKELDRRISERFAPSKRLQDPIKSRNIFSSALIESHIAPPKCEWSAPVHERLQITMDKKHEDDAAWKSIKHLLERELDIDVISSE